MLINRKKNVRKENIDKEIKEQETG